MSTRRILIVDDEAALRLVCRVNLRFAGFETLEAADGRSALSLARSEEPDLILLDVMIPGPDGWEVAEALRSSPETRSIPIVFLSALASKSDERRGYEVGGVAFIKKPFDPGALAPTIDQVLERVRAGEEEQLRAEWLARLTTSG